MKQPHVWGTLSRGIWRGPALTGIDANEPGGVATRNSCAWMNASWGNPEPHFRLCVRAIENWHRLEQEVPLIHYRRGRQPLVGADSLDSRELEAARCTRGLGMVALAK